MTDIEQWLANPADYEEGRLLYERYGTFPRLKATLARGADDLNWQYLPYELEKIKHMGKPVVIDKPLVINLIFETETDSLPPVVEKLKEKQEAQLDLEYAAMPEQVQTMVERWKLLYKEASHWQSQLEVAESDEKRCLMAFAIQETFDTIHDLWDQLEYYRNNGKLEEKPDDEPPVLTDPVAIHTRINNLKSYISRGAKRGKTEQEILAWQKEKEALEILLASK